MATKTGEVSSDPDVFAQCTDTIIRQVGDIGRMVDEFSSFARMPAPVFRREIVDDLLTHYYEPRGIQLRGCHPRDLIAQATSLAEYLGQDMELTPELIASACSSYFVDNRGAVSSR